MEHVAGLSGAALGYITGNIPGAYYGYKYGKKIAQYSKRKKERNALRVNKVRQIVSERMSHGNRRSSLFSAGSAPGTPSNSGRALQRIGYRSTVSRSGRGSGRLRSILRRSGKGRAKVMKETLDVGSMVRKKGTLKRKAKKRKVKVSKGLRQKINKVIEGSKFHGYYKEVSYSNMTFTANVTDKQDVFNEPLNFIVGTNTGTNQCVFSWMDILNAFNVLWYEWVPPGTNQTLAAVTTPGPITAVAQFRRNSWASMGTGIQFFNTTLQVNKVWCTIKLKNQHHRTLRVKMLKIYPKRNIWNTENVHTPYDHWQGLLSSERGDTAYKYTGLTAVAMPINVSGVSPTTLGSHPKQFSAWKKLWKYDEVDMVFEPGQTQSLTVDGPTNKAYNGRKYFRSESAGSGDVTAGSDYVIHDTNTCFFMYIVESDLCSYTTSNGTFVGRPLGVNGGDTSGLIAEYSLHYSLVCPDIIGFGGAVSNANTGTAVSGGNATGTGLAAQQPLNAKRHAYATVVYSQNYQAANVTAISDTLPSGITTQTGN